MTGHALVVGGDIHSRLELRQRLRAEGFHVTLERSVLRGLVRLSQHRYAVCALDLTDVPGARRYRRDYRHLAGRLETDLRDNVANVGT